eukprot:COSAG01_NODE_1786_length_9231_cov_19.575276_8_plen_136_part_00
MLLGSFRKTSSARKPAERVTRNLQSCMCLIASPRRLQALSWIFEAQVGEGAQVPTMMQLRLWTKMLIDRSLVLGPIDQPSLHDVSASCLLRTQHMWALRTCVSPIEPGCAVCRLCWIMLSRRTQRKSSGSRIGGW